MRQERHRASAARPTPGANVSTGVTCRMESRARPYAERFRGGGQVDVPQLARLHGIDETDIDGRGQSHVLRDVHPLAPSTPRADPRWSDAQCLGRLAFVSPSVEPEGGFEQGHGSEALLPARFLSFRRTRVLVGIGDPARVGEDGLLDVLERDPQEGSDAHDLMEWRSPHAAEFPALDRAGADADDLSKPRTRVARRLATLLEESGNGCLLDGHRRIICGSTAFAAYASDLRELDSRESTEASER
jgi:hypothetical protein